MIKKTILITTLAVFFFILTGFDSALPLREVGRNYDEIPSMITENEDQIKESNFTEVDGIERLQDNIFEVRVLVKDSFYEFVTKIPEDDFIVDDLQQENGDWNVSFGGMLDENEEESKILYFQKDLSRTSKPFEEIDGERIYETYGSTTLNLNSGEYSHNRFVSLETFTYKNTNNVFELYVMFGENIDFIDTISTEYDFRNVYFGVAGDWQHAAETYKWGDTQEIKPHRSIIYGSTLAGTALGFAKGGPTTALIGTAAGTLGGVMAYTSIDKAGLYDQPAIQQVELGEIPGDVQNDFVYNNKGDYQFTKDEGIYHAEQENLFKVVLGQHRDWLSTDYDIDNFSVTEVYYSKDGKVEAVEDSIIESAQPKNTLETPWLIPGQDSTFGFNIPTIAIVGASALALTTISKFNKKRRKDE